MIFKSFNNFRRLVVVEMIRGFRLKDTVILIKRYQKSHVETIQSFHEIIFISKVGNPTLSEN